MSWKGSDALVWSAERHRIASDAAGVALWAWNVDTNEISLDERAHVMWGVPRNGPLTTATLSSHIDPADRDKVRTVMEATRKAPGPYDVDFRILRGHEIRWIAARGLGSDEGIVGRIMFGIFLDVTERKLAEEAREMMADEMSHRVKNLFAIASSLTAIAARSAATTTEMARDLTQRLAALAGAHDLIRLDSAQEGGKAALLGDLFSVFLAPYDDKGIVGDRIHVSLPEVRVGENSATALALIVHELATNSVKYGSLSVAAGTLDVSSADHNGDVAILWTERGGPQVSFPTGPGGFGTRLVSRSVAGQLGGSIAVEWQPEGVVITLRLSKGHLIA
jgi:two-component sensor histidine kinase